MYVHNEKRERQKRDRQIEINSIGRVTGELHEYFTAPGKPVAVVISVAEEASCCL